MRRIIVYVLAVALGGSAMAADLNSAAIPAKAPVYAQAYRPAFSWAGQYIGVNLGGGTGDFGFSPLASPALGGGATAFGATSSNGNAGVGGLQVGRNWQFGQWVLGIEHEVQFTGMSASMTVGTTATDPFAPGDNFSAKVDYLSGTRAKVGWAWNRFMVYAAGGLETGEVDVTGSYVSRGGLGANAPLSFSDTHKFQFGYTVGGGAEYAVTNNVSLGVEYRYLTLGKVTYNLGTVTSATGVINNITTDVSLNSSQVVGRLNVKFDTHDLFGF